MKSNDKPNRFFSYDTGLKTWTELTNDTIPPFDSVFNASGVRKLKKLYVKDGAAMVNDGSAIYATKGGGYNVFGNIHRELAGHGQIPYRDCTRNRSSRPVVQ